MVAEHGLHQAQKGRLPRNSRSACPRAWWRRGESNPRPKILYSGPLRAFPVIWISSPGTPAGRVPFGPSREKARPSAPREEASGYPVRVTSSRLYGHSTVGGRRLKPPELTDSRWRLLVSRFLRGAGPRHATHEHRHPRRSRFAPLQSIIAGWRTFGYDPKGPPNRGGNPGIAARLSTSRKGSRCARNPGGRHSRSAERFPRIRVARSMSRRASRSAMSCRLS